MQFYKITLGSAESLCNETFFIHYGYFMWWLNGMLGMWPGWGWGAGWWIGWGSGVSVRGAERWAWWLGRQVVRIGVVCCTLWEAVMNKAIKILWNMDWWVVVILLCPTLPVCGPCSRGSAAGETGGLGASPVPASSTKSIQFRTIKTPILLWKRWEQRWCTN